MKMRKEIGKSYITYSPEGYELTIDMVYVAPENRGQGIGKELVAIAIQYARENEFESVGLYAEPQSDDGLATDALIAFYESCGFEKDGDCAQLMSYTI
jgi:ribosomal protein S18 acetylase RimI-like enzyme